MSVETAPTRPAKPRVRFDLALPPADLTLPQNEEWFVVRTNGAWKRLRVHDYAELFSTPGLYEYLLGDVLKCDSPGTIRGLLDRALRESGQSAKDLRVLDLGAGNGMVGEELASLGARELVGVDIIEEAAEAARRDRPEVYDEYVVGDITRLGDVEKRELASRRLNCMTCVAALGFGDIPTRAFASAYNLIETGGWVAFNIKEDFLQQDDRTGFAQLIHCMTQDRMMVECVRERYVHRLGTDRQPLHYVGIVARKREAIDPRLLDD